ncbi:MAG: ATP-dependent Clp protease ATP-binding subunit, partial [Patescibacteria group bacterium]
AGSASGSMDAANILKPALARGDIHCIGATTHGEYKKHIESDSALERRFQSIQIEEPSEQTAMEILSGIAPHYESFHDVRISAEAIEQAVNLSVRYLTDRRLPDKAIDLLDEAAAHVRLHRTEIASEQIQKNLQRKIEEIQKEKRQAVIEERFLDAVDLKATEDLLFAERNNLTIPSPTSKHSVIDGEAIARVVSRTIGIPLVDLLKQDTKSAEELSKELSKRVLGQSSVIETVSGALRRAKSGVSHPSRPLASFLFLGPSGVGKTELAKAIAEQIFSGGSGQNAKHLIRLDMSEYSEGFTMSKLIGAPAGYVGYKEHANLTDRVRQKPYAVVLFDEIEKAHRDVQNLLLQILEEGELSDASGKMVNFKNTIIVLTSNVGLEQFEQGGIGFSSSETEITKRRDEDVHKELKERFRPELLNRIDHTCLFHALSQDTLTEICRKQLDELIVRMKQQDISLSIGDAVSKHLLKHMETKSGARSIRQLIQTHVESLLAEHILKKNHSKKIEMRLLGKKMCVRQVK